MIASFCRRYASAIIRLGLVLTTALVCTGQIEAQQRKGLWLEFSGDVGTTLDATPTYVLDKDNSHYAALGLTLGVHLPGLSGLQLGIGGHSVGHSNPSSLTFAGLHLEAKYNPLASLRGLQLGLRVGKPLIKGTRALGFEHFDPRLYGTLSVGWEFDNLLGFVGLTPAIGVSHARFDYQGASGSMEGATSEPAKVSSGQTTIFLRLGIRLN